MNPDDPDICSKVRYTKVAAQTALNRALKDGRLDYGRIYPCNFCGCYHLTRTRKIDTEIKSFHLVYISDWKRLLNNG